MNEVSQILWKYLKEKVTIELTRPKVKFVLIIQWLKLFKRRKSD